MKRTLRANFLFAFAIVLLVLLTGAALLSRDVFSPAEPADGVAARNYDPDLGTFVSPSSGSGKGIKLAQGDPSLLRHREIVNVVIFICFQGETPSSVFSPSSVSVLENKFNGESFSLLDYYRTLSYGSFTVRSIFPGTGSYAYVYQAPYERAYYENVTADTGAKRYDPESALLNAAVRAAASYFEFTGITLDANADGFVDSVSFVVSNAYDEDSWGHLLWPHAWNLQTISEKSSYKTDAATLGGARVDSYTLTFAGAFKLGLITHEFGHLVGLPDLYHYDKSTKYYTDVDADYLPVWCWDLMHENGDVPRFTLSYLRGDGYLHFLEKSQVPELTVSGTYTLTPTVKAGRSDVLAYKITISSTESIWMEYRFNDPNTYERELPSSGLIVYRVNTAADGNTESKHESTSYPYEAYVFRHAASPYPSNVKSTTAIEKYDLERAALRTTGIYSSLGDKTSTKSYDPNCIFLTNGKNTGVVVTVLSQNANSLTFSIDLGDYDCSDVSDSYVIGTDLTGKEVKNEHHVYYGIDPDISVYLKYKNRQEAVELFDYSLEYDRTVTSGSQTACVVFTDVYGERRIPFTLYVYDVATMEATLFSPPTKTTLRVGEALSLDGLAITINYRSGKEERVIYSTQNADKWTIVEGLNVNVHGTYDHVRIQYADVAYCILSGVVVRSDLVSIRVEERNTHHLVGANFTPVFTVIGTYYDGKEDTLDPSLYTVSYDENASTTRVTATIAARENDEATATTYLYNVRNESVVSLSLSEPMSATVNYGAEPDFTGRTLRLNVSGGETIALPLENYAAELLSTFSPTKVGVQKLVGAVGAVSYSVTVTVLPRSSDTLTTESDDLFIEEDKGVLCLLKPMTLGELTSVLTPCSDFTLAFRDATKDYALIDGAFDARPVGTDSVQLTVYTPSGIVVRSFTVFLLGDADKNGKVDEDDVDFWLAALLDGRDRSYPYLDANHDGKYTLTDFVLLLGGLA